MFVTRNVMMKYRNPTDGEGSDLGGGAGGDDKGGSADDNGGAADDKGGAADYKGDDKGGKTGPSDAEAKLIKENMAKKEQLRKAQEEIAALRKSVEGLDLEEVRKLVADRKTAEEKALEAKGDYERLKQRMAEEHSKEVTTLKAQLEALQGEKSKLATTINDLTVGTQFSQSQFINGELTLTPAKARVIYGDYFDVEDGKIVGYDKPRGSANRTALVDQYGSAVPFDAALRKIVEADPEKDHLLKSKVKAGAGSDSKKASSEPAKEQATDSVSRIAAGLKGLKIS
jgi:hypothetical protein